jgi:hypothetical protein
MLNLVGMKLELLCASIRAREPAIHGEQWQADNADSERRLPPARVQMAAQALHNVKQFLEIVADFTAKQYQKIHITTWTHTLYVLLMARKLIFLDVITPANLLRPVSAEAAHAYAGTGWDPVLAAEQSGISISGSKMLTVLTSHEVYHSRLQYMGMLVRGQLEGYRQRSEVLRRAGSGSECDIVHCDQTGPEAASRAEAGDQNGSAAAFAGSAAGAPGTSIVNGSGSEAFGREWAEPSFDQLADWLSGQDMEFWSASMDEGMADLPMSMS